MFNSSPEAESINTYVRVLSFVHAYRIPTYVDCSRALLHLRQQISTRDRFIFFERLGTLLHARGQIAQSSVQRFQVIHK
eukprot:SAG31_NODE_836_length_11643_cov_3.389813_4_plen_79_part_00